MANVQEKAWAAQKKALAARMSQTFPQLSKLNGYGIGTDGTIDKANAAQIFITEGLSKVYKIASICSSDKIASCGISPQITMLGGAKTMNIPTSMEDLNVFFTTTYKEMDKYERNTEANGGIVQNTKAAAFETLNGESVLLFYNPNCKQYGNPLAQHYGANEICVNMIYDVNGIKTPNEVGKDIGFMTVFYPTDTVVAAPVIITLIPSSSTVMHLYKEGGNDAISFCKKQDTNSRLPDMYEAYSIISNMNILGIDYDIWSGTPTKGTGEKGFTMSACVHGGIFAPIDNFQNRALVCVKK